MAYTQGSPKSPNSKFGQKGVIVKVVDLTFQQIEEENDIEELLKIDPTILSCKKNEIIGGFRLSNNHIKSMDILFGKLAASVDLDEIRWIDLSFNHISEISPELYKYFPYLETINLQANQISKIKEVRNLLPVARLKSFTMNGNPCEKFKHYRKFCLHTLRTLRKFDMSPITDYEWSKVDVWSNTFRNVLEPEDD